MLAKMWYISSMEMTVWRDALKEALSQRYIWLSSSEIPKLRDSFRQFHIAYSMLYNILVNRGAINADIYKNESKVSDLVMPEVGMFNEVDKHGQFSLRLANYDNQLDYIVNFYTLSTDTLTQDKIKILLAVVKFVDWQHTTPDAPSQNTQAMAGIITKERQRSLDPLTAKNFNESLKKLEVASKEILRQLKNFSDYNRELYKASIREQIIAKMSPSAVTVANIKKAFPGAFKGVPFYSELVEEILREDYSPDGPSAQKKVLEKLAVAGVGEKQEKVKPQVTFKPHLIEGLNAIGSAGITLGEILAKVEINHNLFQGKKKSLAERIKEVFAQIVNKDVDTVVYVCESADPNRNGAVVKEKIPYHQFYEEVDKKSKILRALAAKGSAEAKLEAMQEGQLAELLDRNIRDMQIYHRRLSFFDDFFKSEVDEADKGKVRGIKPELSTIKNAIAKALAKRYDYTEAQEEAAQFRKLGIEV
jgi:phenylpyruvate tautomerase PptA (4-oxalocrotonate tautomerase family)